MRHQEMQNRRKNFIDLWCETPVGKVVMHILTFIVGTWIAAMMFHALICP